MVSRLLCVALTILTINPSFAFPRAEEFHWSVRELIVNQLRLHPLQKAQDIYKLFYQSSFGVEHILADSMSAAKHLLDELALLDSAADREPLIERISLENDIVRINLRPFRALNLDPLALVKVMFESARETVPDTVMFYREWNEFSALLHFGLLDFRPDDFDEWNAKVKDGKIAPVHHSGEYTATNKPAYRVVQRSVFETVFGKIDK
jgi:hypothetical protein